MILMTNRMNLMKRSLDKDPLMDEGDKDILDLDDNYDDMMLEGVWIMMILMKMMK